jgi:hypothetical protein
VTRTERPISGEVCADAELTLGGGGGAANVTIFPSGASARGEIGIGSLMLAAESVLIGNGPADSSPSATVSPSLPTETTRTGFRSIGALDPGVGFAGLAEAVVTGLGTGIGIWFSTKRGAVRGPADA